MDPTEMCRSEDAQELRPLVPREVERPELGPWSVVYMGWATKGCSTSLGPLPFRATSNFWMAHYTSVRHRSGLRQGLQMHLGLVSG